MITTLAAMALSGLLMKVLYVVLVLAIIGCLIWFTEYFIVAIPDPVKIIIAIIVLILVVIQFLGGGGL